MDQSALYRAAMFDGQADLAWLRQGWRGLRLYGRRARAAIDAGDPVARADMIARADGLLTLMAGIVDSSQPAGIGSALLTIYSALRFALLRANINDSIAALDDFEAALAILDRDMIKSSESAIAA